MRGVVCGLKWFRLQGDTDGWHDSTHCLCRLEFSMQIHLLLLVKVYWRRGRRFWLTSSIWQTIWLFSISVLVNSWCTRFLTFPSLLILYSHTGTDACVTYTWSPIFFCDSVSSSSKWTWKADFSTFSERFSGCSSLIAIFPSSNGRNKSLQAVS